MRRERGLRERGPWLSLSSVASRGGSSGAQRGNGHRKQRPAQRHSARVRPCEQWLRGGPRLSFCALDGENPPPLPLRRQSGLSKITGHQVLNTKRHTIPNLSSTLGTLTTERSQCMHHPITFSRTIINRLRTKKCINGILNLNNNTTRDREGKAIRIHRQLEQNRHL